jgi:hypothetical protein
LGFQREQALLGALVPRLEQVERQIGELHLQGGNLCFELDQARSQINVGCLTWP